MKRVNDEFDSLLYKIAGEKYRDFVSILKNWTTVVGELNADRTAVDRFEKKILYVKVVNHVWRQQFILLKPDLLNKLREITNIDIVDLKFFC
jgi:hypothetical protein